MNKAEKSLRWVVNQIPDFTPKNNEEKMLVAIKFYSDAGAEEIKRLEAENAALRERLGKVPVFEIYQDVFIIDYLDERGYSVRSGKAIIRSCFIRHIMQVGKDSFIYFVQPNDLPKELLNDSTLHDEYWDRSFYAKDIFADREAAEARLKELGGRR